MASLLVENTFDDTEGEDEVKRLVQVQPKEDPYIVFTHSSGSMSGFLQATLRATFRLVALLESARSTHGPGRCGEREALRLVLLVSVPMRLVHGGLALTF